MVEYKEAELAVPELPLDEPELDVDDPELDPVLAVLAVVQAPHVYPSAVASVLPVPEQSVTPANIVAAQVAVARLNVADWASTASTAATAGVDPLAGTAATAATAATAQHPVEAVYVPDINLVQRASAFSLP